MARLETRSNLARLVGVSPSAITQACKSQLADACVGKRIDLDHAAVQAYLAGKGVTSTPPPIRKKNPPPAPTAPRPDRARSPKAKGRPRANPPPAPAPAPAEDDADPERFLDMSLRDLTEMFGTVVAFKDWLDARKKIADIREKDLKNEETDGTLIPRELVQSHLFGAIEAGNRRLLGDSPKTIARRVYAMAKSESPVEEAEAVVREIISSQLKPVSATASRVLRNA